MARWQCKAGCGAIFDNGPSTKIEDSAKEIAAEVARPCPMCGAKDGWLNLDAQQESGIILPTHGFPPAA